MCVSLSEFKIVKEGANIGIELSKDYLDRLAKRLRWSFEDVVNNFGCEEVREGAYMCYAVKVGEDGTIVVYPYTMALIERMKEEMKKFIRF